MEVSGVYLGINQPTNTSFYYQTDLNNAVASFYYQTDLDNAVASVAEAGARVRHTRGEALVQPRPRTVAQFLRLRLGCEI